MALAYRRCRHLRMEACSTSLLKFFLFVSGVGSFATVVSAARVVTADRDSTVHGDNCDGAAADAMWSQLLENDRLIPCRLSLSSLGELQVASRNFAYLVPRQSLLSRAKYLTHAATSTEVADDFDGERLNLDCRNEDTTENSPSLDEARGANSTAGRSASSTPVEDEVALRPSVSPRQGGEVQDAVSTLPSQSLFEGDQEQFFVDEVDVARSLMRASRREAVTTNNNVISARAATPVGASSSSTTTPSAGGPSFMSIETARTLLARPLVYQDQTELRATTSSAREVEDVGEAVTRMHALGSQRARAMDELVEALAAPGCRAAVSAISRIITQQSAPIRVRVRAMQVTIARIQLWADERLQRQRDDLSAALDSVEGMFPAAVLEHDRDVRSSTPCSGAYETLVPALATVASNARQPELSPGRRVGTLVILEDEAIREQGLLADVAVNSLVQLTLMAGAHTVGRAALQTLLRIFQNTSVSAKTRKIVHNSLCRCSIRQQLTTDRNSPNYFEEGAEVIRYLNWYCTSQSWP
ncbi:unnamed protein product [Amoebophrya sp. A25]|nr:unnamed protein product [Amoebophrya sp. A25]|eukprot:GSA25T00002227001.1